VSSSRQFYLLKTRRFLPLFITQFFGAFNDNTFKAAFIMLITFKLVNDIAHAQLLVYMIGGVFILPFLLFSHWAGKLADQYNRNIIVRWIKAAEIIFMLLAGIGFHYGNVQLLMFVLFCMGTHSAFFGPIKYSALPDLLEQRELLGGNGLVEASTFVAILIGTIIGTKLGVTIEGALIVAGLSLLAAIIGLTSSFYIPILPINKPAIASNESPLQNRVVLHTMLAISWFWLIGFMLVTQLPVYTKDVLYGGENIVALFSALFSIGIAVGSILCNRLLKGVINSRYVPLGILGMSLFILDLCWAGQATPFTANNLVNDIGAFVSTFAGARITLDLLLLSVCGGFYAVPLYAMMQTESKPEFRSRVVGYNNIFNALFMVAASGVGVLLTKLGFSITQTFVLLALSNLVVALLVHKKLPAGLSQAAAFKPR
jgi:acyl-[acyl-carrier-protein]-phospholipid O-acyltransferase/long-chain-fatty-acid--[acyl-carrier-protein] ligase